MNILLITIVFASSLLYSAADEFDGAWGFSGKLVTRDASIAEKDVMIPFWQKMKEKPCWQKSSILIKLCKALPGDLNYPERRLNMAAAVYAGVDLGNLASTLDLSKEYYCGLVLEDPIRQQDCDLTRLLLEHKANVHEKYSSDYLPVIYLAKIYPLAELLINFRALKENTRSRNGTLLHRAMCNGYEPELITLYKKHGIDPMTPDNNDNTPLIRLADEADQYETSDLVIKKASLLLENLPKEKAIALIKAKNSSGDAVICRISTRIRQKDRVKNLRDFAEYLVGTLESLQNIEKVAPALQVQEEKDVNNNNIYEKTNSTHE